MCIITITITIILLIIWKYISEAKQLPSIYTEALLILLLPKDILKIGYMNHVN